MQPSVLTNGNRNAVQSDFGLGSITVDAGSELHAPPMNTAGSIRWIAPEWLSVFNPNEPDAVTDGLRGRNNLTRILSLWWSLRFVHCHVDSRLISPRPGRPD